jgi:p-cumate 2,3-dioxygenase beta subunit
VPPLDLPDARPGSALFLVTDDRTRLESRVNQLLGRSAWAENPHSRTRRLVTNVRVLDSDATDAHVTANFAIWRFSNQRSNVYIGKYVNRLRFEDGRWRIRERQAILDLEALRPHGRLSFIL